MTSKSFMKELQQIAANDASLSIINWNDAGIGNVGATLLFRGLRRNTSAVVLFARCNEISRLTATDENQNTTIHWGSLQFCYLSDNPIHDASFLTSACPLRILHLAYCQIADATPIANTIRHNTTLQQLDLRGNPLQAAGLVKMAQALHENTTLQRLHLSVPRDNNDKDSNTVSKAFVHMLRHFNTTLVRLDGLDDGNIEYFLSLNRAGRRYWDQGWIPRQHNSAAVWFAFLQYCPNVGGGVVVNGKTTSKPPRR